MYSLGSRDLQERRRLAHEANVRRHNRKQLMTARDRDRLLRGIYGRSFAQLGFAAEARREALRQKPLQPVVSTGSLLSHSYRDRDATRELGTASVSSRRYVARACYKGGGVLDRARTAGYIREPVDVLDSRFATTSVTDIVRSLLRS